MLTLQDIKTLESLFIVEMHSAERIFRLIETGMETIYRESKDYKALVKKHGKPAADQIVRHYTHQVLKSLLGLILSTAASNSDFTLSD